MDSLPILNGTPFLTFLFVVTSVNWSIHKSGLTKLCWMIVASVDFPFLLSAPFKLGLTREYTWSSSDCGMIVGLSFLLGTWTVTVLPSLDWRSGIVSHIWLLAVSTLPSDIAVKISGCWIGNNPCLIPRRNIRLNDCPSGLPAKSVISERIVPLSSSTLTPSGNKELLKANPART